MKITKYEHSCLDIRDGGTRIVVDPGKFSQSLVDLRGISALVITHIHSDHFVIDTVKKILEQNPDVQIYTVKQVTDEINHSNATVVKAGQSFDVSNMNLKFFGGNHELYDGFENIGVLVNDNLYYPGDSYTVPDAEVKTLAAPASAPWLRIPDAVQFIKDCKPEIVFPMHNFILSEAGEEIHYRILSAACEESGIEWKVLKPGETLEI